MGFGLGDYTGIMGFGGFNFMGLIGGLFFLVVLSLFVFVLVKSIGQWHKNNNSPVLTVDAKVVAKRGDYHRGTGDSMGHTTYYATFQVESGDRLELCVPDDQYGYLVEGDLGKLTFQGTRFLGFRRG